MRKSMVITLIAVVVVVAGGLGAYFATRSSGNKTPAANNMSNMNMSSTNNNTNSAPVATNAVTIQNFAFSPHDITLKKGTTVIWTNKDSTTHTVTETDSLSGPNSGNLDPGKSYSFTFDTVGTFHYHCTIHPQMLGTVKVTE